MSIARMFTTTVSVETLAGVNANGQQYAAAVQKKAAVTDGTRLVRNTNGEEVVSTTTLYAPLTDVAAYTPGTRVTVNGFTSNVIDAVRRDKGPARMHHVEIHLN